MRTKGEAACDEATPKRALWAIALTCVVFGLACSTPKQNYPGPPRPAEEIAVLTETSNASVIEIDGESVSGNSWALLPGPHQVLMHVRTQTGAPNMNWTIWSYCQARFDAKAGERYQSVVRMRKEVAPGLKERVRMEVGVVDAEEVMRGWAFGCDGKRPGR